MSSMNNKAPQPFSSSNNEQTTDDSPEESSWTFYMQDFPCGNNDAIVSFSSGCDDHKESTTHAVSDAFSSAGRKACDNNTGTAAFTSAISYDRQSSFKRRKSNVGASVNDHDLEDTASSPANSPKESSYINQLNFNQNEKDKINVLEGNIGRNNTIEEVVGVDDEDENNNQSELKKKGLCLVPVSMLRDYFG